MSTSPHVDSSREDAPRGLSRRSVLGRSAAGAGIALSGSFTGLFGRAPRRRVRTTAPAGRRRATRVTDPWSTTRPDCSALPAGFGYTVVAQSGVSRLESGEPAPSDPDGTASFVRRGGNGSVLVVNDEVSGSEPHPVPRGPGFDLRSRRRRRDDEPRGRQGPQPGASVRQPGRHAEQLRRRKVAVAHVADLRGGREPDRADQAARIRVRGRSLRPGRQP